MENSTGPEISNKIDSHPWLDKTIIFHKMLPEPLRLSTSVGIDNYKAPLSE